MKKTSPLYIGIAVLFAVLGVVIAHRQISPQPAEPAATSQLFNKSFADAKGQQQSMAQWRGRTLVVNFWAPWCAPCVEEMPELVELQRELTQRAIQIIGLGIDSPSNISQFAEKYEISFPLYVGGLEGATLSSQLGNQAGGLPFTVVIGNDGNIKHTYLGRLKMDQLRQDLAKL